VDLIARSAGNHVSNCEAIDASGGYYLDTLGSSTDQFGDHLHTVVCGLLLAAGHDTMKFNFNQLVQRIERIRRNVEGTMKNRLAITSLLQQFAATVHIHSAISSQDAEDDPISPVLQGNVCVTLHYLEVGVTVSETAGSWSDHDHHRQRNGSFHLDQRAERWRQPAQQKRCIEFESVSATGLGRKRVFDGRDGNFERYALAQCTTINPSL